MKNQNKVRSYWGYWFLFENEEMIDRFISLYEDVILDYEILERDSYKDGIHPVKIVVEKGAIDKIRKGLGDLIVPTQHKRYLVKRA